VNTSQHFSHPAGLLSREVELSQTIAKNYSTSALPVAPAVPVGLGKRYDFQQPTSALRLGFAQIQLLRSGITRRPRTSALPHMEAM
jgi:hypothetical protein